MDQVMSACMFASGWVAGLVLRMTAQSIKSAYGNPALVTEAQGKEAGGTIDGNSGNKIDQYFITISERFAF